MSVTLDEYREVIETRPYKFTAEQVNYRPAPEGSAMRCAGCFHLYRRAIDSLGVCEIFRNEEVDSEGIDPAFRCDWFTTDGDVFPLAEEE